MRYLLLIILLTSCTAGKASTIVKTDDGVIFTAHRPTKMTYKDKEIEATYDSQSPSLIRSVVEAGMLKEINNN